MSKRPRDESAPDSQTRTKRDRYTSIACNECKKRKVKCNGEVPCQRCANLKADCIYASKRTVTGPGGLGDVEDLKRINTRLSSLQAQVDVLFVNLGPFLDPTIRSPFESFTRSPNDQQAFHLRTSTSSQLPSTLGHTRSNRPQFIGPTSSAFGFGVANSSLKSMGYQSGTKAGEQDLTSHPVSPSDTSSLPLASNPLRDPLWLLEKSEALRLIGVYDEEIGSIYPFLDLKRIEGHVAQFYSHPDTVPTAFEGNPEIGVITESDIRILKLVLAIGLIVEGRGESNLGARLVEHGELGVQRGAFKARADSQMLLRLMLESHYHFLSDEESLAWRVIGVAARMALEMGLHRRDNLFRKFPDSQRRRWAVNLFWCIYVLDRRWSFGTGMPFALQDSDIDLDLPEPDSSTPYLTCMIAYARLGSKVWKSVAMFGSTPLKVKKEKSAYLDFQILQWQRSIPSELQLTHLDTRGGVEQQPSRSTHRHRVLLYLRAVQMRILIYRQMVLSPNSIAEDPVGAQLVVDLAKDTIHVLNRLNQTTDIYRSLQVLFNYFLVSALAILFLAVCHAPAQYGQTCRDEYYAALDLVKGFSAKSSTSRRLWKTIEDLKTIGPKLGLVSQDARASGDATGTNSGTRTPRVDDGVIFGPDGCYPSDEELGMTLDGIQMSSELTNLFEAAGRPMIEGSGATDINADMEGGVSGHMESHLFGNDDVLSRIMSDLF